MVATRDRLVTNTNFFPKNDFNYFSLFLIETISSIYICVFHIFLLEVIFFYFNSPPKKNIYIIYIKRIYKRKEIYEEKVFLDLF